MLKLYSYGKINLFLDVEGRLNNGYHLIKSIMQSIDLHDEIVLNPIKENRIIIECSDTSIPTNENNTCYKAARLIKETYSINTGIHIYIQKNIPSEAGLAGGSGNAAAVIKGFNNLWNLNLSLHEMQVIGLKIGADIPFCLVGGTCLAEGIGDKVTEINDFLWDNILIIKPDFSMSTAFVYKNLSPMYYNLYKDNRILDYIVEGNYEEAAICVANTLEKVVEKIHPEINHVKELMINKGALSCIMTGSGSALFALFNNEAEMDEAYIAAKNIFPKVYKTRTVKTGAIFCD
ncbi:MAG TPA: 4-(cytidine 5'-diphospho)-2-C-methyl-D-erythritol kinase [Tissierellia bacterium]|nr:4-(cytidine 5'-diphospho)-2-C-methyl-D-erythritol kinase [Tissierellia bacterium]